MNLASHMIHDAHQNKMDCAVLVTGDSDLLEPIKILKNSLGKVVGIVNPQQNPTQVLKRNATFYKHASKNKIISSQFPNSIFHNGHTIIKPNAW